MVIFLSCGIPVVVMGETGCGKTRLLKYLCKLASQNAEYKTQTESCIVVLKVRSIEMKSIIMQIVRFMVELLDMTLKRLSKMLKKLL